MVTSVTNLTAANSSASAKGTSSAQEQTDRFMKLLVAQLNNQDPMNPMDNAQMTSQIAQINTVSGIQELNTTMQGMVNQFSTLQSMQGASMIGRTVLADGDTLSVDKIKDDKGVTTTNGKGAFTLAGDASNVSVQVVNASGQVIDTVNLGPKNGGYHNFDWKPDNYTGSGSLSFKVQATQGSKAVAASTLVRDQVAGVGVDEKGLLNLVLRNGSTLPYSAVQLTL